MSMVQYLNMFGLSKAMPASGITEIAQDLLNYFAKEEWGDEPKKVVKHRNLERLGDENPNYTKGHLYAVLSENPTTVRDDRGKVRTVTTQHLTLWKVVDTCEVPIKGNTMVDLTEEDKQTQQEKQDMNNEDNKLVIKTRTYVNGDVLDDDAIFAMIQAYENKIKNYENIKHQPQKLKDKILELQLDIVKLVKLVDNRP